MLPCFVRDIRLATAHVGAILTVLLFFATVVAAIPLAVGPDSKLLSVVGPGLIWVSALLATLLSLDQLFQSDKADGSLDLIVMSGARHNLALIILGKCGAHWLGNILPLIILSPLLCLLLNLSAWTSLTLIVTLLSGTPALTLIGTVGSALAASSARPNILASIIILPLTMPVLIFAVSATTANLSFSPAFISPFLLLIALTLFFLVCGPIIAVLALRYLYD